MTCKQEQRVAIIARVADGRMTWRQASMALDLSERQIGRLLGRFKIKGGAALAHGAIGKPSNNRIPDDVRAAALTHLRAMPNSIGPTKATHLLKEQHGISVSRETVRTWIALIQN
jgi:hypothetical protein